MYTVICNLLCAEPVGALRGQQRLTELLCALVPARPVPTATGEPPFLQLVSPIPIFSEQAAVATSCPQGQDLRNFCPLIKMW